ncbi:MAG: LytR/AlgR family response regulator transcription factor [Bacteroidia bacterium]
MDVNCRCLIADDEAPAHLVLQSHIAQVPGMLCTGNAHNGAEALSMMSSGQFDLVFLDIDMPVISGLDLLRNVPRRPAVIITTAYENFAFDAYQLDAVDYLLKPIALPRFLKAIEKARPFFTVPAAKTTIQVTVKGEQQHLVLAEISHIESLGNYVRIHFTAKRIPLTVYGSLREMLELLSGTSFIQIHKSFILNTKAADQLTGNSVRIKTGEQLPVGRKYELLLAQHIG